MIIPFYFTITCDIGINSIHKYIYISRSGKCLQSVCNVLLCKYIVLSIKIENYKKRRQAVSFIVDILGIKFVVLLILFELLTITV